MTTAEAEKIAAQLETMLMGVDIKPDTMTIDSSIVAAIQYEDNKPSKYIISDLQGTHVVDGRSLKCPEQYTHLYRNTNKDKIGLQYYRV